LQVEASACVLGLANVLFVRWLFIILFFIFLSYSGELSIEYVAHTLGGNIDIGALRLFRQYITQ